MSNSLSKQLISLLSRLVSFFISQMQSITEQTIQEINTLNRRYLVLFHQLETGKMEDLSLAQFKLMTILKRTAIILNDYELEGNLEHKIKNLMGESRELMYRHKLDSLGSQDVQTEVCAVLQKTMKFRI